jgi:hypothetical protein
MTGWTLGHTAAWLPVVCVCACGGGGGPDGYLGFVALSGDDAGPSSSSSTADGSGSGDAASYGAGSASSGGSSGSNSGGQSSAGDDAGAPGVCDRSTCARGCCDSTGTCQSGALDIACGVGGGACLSCLSFGQTCVSFACAGGAGGSSSGGSSSGGSFDAGGRTYDGGYRHRDGGGLVLPDGG